jgi:hypothetical protein
VFAFLTVPFGLSCAEVGCSLVCQSRYDGCIESRDPGASDVACDTLHSECIDACPQP